MLTSIFLNFTSKYSLGGSTCLLNMNKYTNILDTSMYLIDTSSYSLHTST